MGPVTQSEPPGSASTGGVSAIRPQRLFVAICFALVSTSVSFAVISDIMETLKSQFILTNQQVGWIGGASLWGFTLSIFVFGPLCDIITMRRLVWLAFLGHVAGVLIMVMAQGFWMLFGGALVIGMANGFVEAVGNPMVATLYPERKTERLNHFHVWFPGGITIGGLVAYAMTHSPLDDWRLKLCLILVPTLVYGILFLGQRIPATERAQSGISTGEMFRATLLRPLFWFLFICMTMTASLELGPNRWMPAVLGAAGISGILVLAWISGLMAVVRYFCGPIVHRLSPTGLLLACVMVSGVGLLWLSYATTTVAAYAAGTIFALGVCCIWPTMLGVTAERIPRGGALALALIGGTGAAVTGLITTPQMGRIGDRYGHRELAPAATVAVLREAEVRLPEMIHRRGIAADDVQRGQSLLHDVLAKTAAAGGALPALETANALRTVELLFANDLLKDKAKALLDPADSFGGRMSFRYVAALAIVLTIFFGILCLRDRAAGGYRAEKIGHV